MSATKRYLPNYLIDVTRWMGIPVEYEISTYLKDKRFENE